ncbi:MAG: site-specific integrase [Phycisphaerae bacterium]
MVAVYKRKGHKKYSFTYRDENGKRRILAGTTSKEGTRRIAEKFANHVRECKLGLVDVKLTKTVANENYPLDDHLDDFADFLESKGGCEKHITKTNGYLTEIIRECRFQTAKDIDGWRVSEYLLRLRRDGKMILDGQGKVLGYKPQSISALNGKLTAMKTFTNWMYKYDRIRTDPLKSLSRDTKGERANKVHARRALTDEEITRLLFSTQNSPVFYGSSGSERVTLYVLALGTGLRAAELRSLTPSSFNLVDLDNATVKVLAAYSKHRRDDVLPIRRDLAVQILNFITEARKLPNARLFHVSEKTYKMIQGDLERARAQWIEEAQMDTEKETRKQSDFLRYRDSNNLVVDFHALRHTFISRLARGGVSPKVAQTLARHSTITLTMDRYTHVLNEDQRTAINQLPEIKLDHLANPLKATGTNDVSGTPKA